MRIFPSDHPKHLLHNRETNRLSYGFRNRIDQPRMYQVIASFPSSSVQIQGTRCRNCSIDPRKLILCTQSSLHGATPCQIIWSSELWCNINWIRALIWMDIENWFGIRLLRLIHYWLLRRRHVEWYEEGEEEEEEDRKRNSAENAGEKEKKSGKSLIQTTMKIKETCRKGDCKNQGWRTWRKSEEEDENSSGRNRNRKRLEK